MLLAIIFITIVERLSGVLIPRVVLVMLRIP